MTALALMNIPEQLEPLVLLYTSLENPGYTFVHQFIIDDGVCTRSAMYLPGFNFIWRESSIDQEISDRLCPGRSGDNCHDHCMLWCDCFFLLGFLYFCHLGVNLRADDFNLWLVVDSPWYCLLC